MISLTNLLRKANSGSLVGSCSSITIINRRIR